MTVEIEPGDNAYQKLNKLLPADATGAFLSIQALITQFTSSLSPDEASVVSGNATASVIILIAALLPFYAKYYLSISKISQIIFLTVTFLVWSIYLGQDQIMNLLAHHSINGDYFPLISGIGMIVWTLIVSPATSHIFK